MAFRSDREGLDGCSDPVGDLRCAVDAVLGQDPGDLPLCEKGGELIRLRRQIDRLAVTTDTDGNPLAVGRATSVWNRAQRRAVTSRSPHCQWPGCAIPAPWCDIHHIVHWEHGGTTDLTNGEHLCRRHHTFVHQHRDWTITFERQQLRVFRPDGTQVHPDAWHDMNWAA